MHPVRGATTFLSNAPIYILFQSNAPRVGCNRRGHCSRSFRRPFQSNAPRVGCNPNKGVETVRERLFQSNAPRVGCNSKTIQFKRIFVTRRMYSFANYVLHILKHLPTYCIGITLQPSIFGAKLPVILCSLKVRTTSITLL